MGVGCLSMRMASCFKRNKQTNKERTEKQERNEKNPEIDNKMRKEKHGMIRYVERKKGIITNKQNPIQKCL